jgi:hypothetical protein
MPYEIRIRLIIKNATPGLLDFDRVEDALRLQSPTKKWRIGDRLDTRSGRRRKSDGISFSVFEGSNCDPIREVTRLVDQLEAGGDAARLILRDSDSELSIVSRLYYGGEDAPMEVPPFHLPHELISKLDRFRLALDLDLYLFSDKTLAPADNALS